MRAVVIPWRQTDCDDRTGALLYVLGQLDRQGHKWSTSGSHYQLDPWRKAVAVSDALRRADEWAAWGDVAAVAVLDADCWIPNLHEAFDALDDGAPWVIPHTHVHRLTRDSTRAVLDGGPLDGQMEDPGPYVGYPGGGCVVLRRETWEQVPMDPRFVGWGHEDKAWSYALTTLVGEPVRLDGVCWHLWHPPQERIDRRVGSLESRELEWRYKAARGNPDAMRALVDEARSALGT